MRTLHTTTVAAIGLCVVLAGCSVTLNQETPKDTRSSTLPKMTLDCIFVGTIDDWKALDNYNLIIYAPTRKTAYLIELDTYCQALHSANRIAVVSHEQGRLCSFGGDALLVGDQRCTIGAIRPYKIGSEPDPRDHP